MNARDKIRSAKNPGWYPSIVEVSAIFSDVIPIGLDLVKAESRCTDYETTLANGQMQVRMKITELVCKETEIEFRVNGTRRRIPTELNRLDKIALVVVSPPTFLRRVTVQLHGIELLGELLGGNV